METTETALAAPQEWTRERVELVKRTVCPKGISDDEFALFIEQCKRSGLDPLLKEAFCVPRRFNAGTREKPDWRQRHEFQPSEAGMLARAERFPDFLGVQASSVYSEDEVAIDAGQGSVHHVFNPAKRKGVLAGAWARVVRKEKAPVVVWVDFDGYVQETPLWRKIPMTMIEKCARVAALRKAYPEAFGGLYVREELPEEEEAPPSPVVERTAERVLSAVAPALPSSSGPVLIFGEKSGLPQGRALAELTLDELRRAAEVGLKGLESMPKDWHNPRVVACLAEIRAELDKRSGATH